MLSQTLPFFKWILQISLCESYGKGLFQFKPSETPICTYLGYFSSFEIFIYIVSFGGFVFKTVNIKINSFISPDHCSSDSDFVGFEFRLDETVFRSYNIWFSSVIKNI